MSVIEEKLKLLPDLPGCYQMRDKDNVVIYVGKAKNLKNRVRSYFHGAHNAKTTRLVQEIVDFTYVITASELEAFVLEINMIKEYDPKYNIMLKDDKTYPYIALTNENNPRLIVTRNQRKRNFARYFGPYPNVKTHHSPAKFKDENIVEYNIEYSCDGIAHHGIIGRSVQPDEKHACAQ